MDAHESLLDTGVLERLVRDIGLENTRRFLQSLDNEFRKRIDNIRQAMTDKAFDELSAQAHSLKSSAQVSGAHVLAEVLIELEIQSRDKNEAALMLAQEALTIADLTRFAFLDIKLTE